VDIVFLNGGCKTDLRLNKGRGAAYPSTLRISQSLRGFMHLEAINTGGEDRCLRTAYPAKSFTSSFFFFLGRVGRKLIWMSLKHLLLIGAANCPRFDMSNEDKKWISTHRHQQARPLGDQGLYNSQQLGHS